MAVVLNRTVMEGSTEKEEGEQGQKEVRQQMPPASGAMSGPSRRAKALLHE